MPSSREILGNQDLPLDRIGKFGHSNRADSQQELGTKEVQIRVKAEKFYAAETLSVN